MIYRNLKTNILALCVSLLLMGTGESFAFGEEGHRIIAALASEQLTPTARRHVALLLADEPDPTLPGIAFWADQHKNRYTAPMHYVNLPAGQCHYDVARDCPDGRCVITAISRYQSELADRGSSEVTRIKALKMLVHLVGDAHQPLHAGLAEDRGGNQFQIQWDGRGSNLHKLWDSQMIESIDPDWMSYAKSLRQGLTPSNDKSGPVQWVEQSCALVNSAGFYPTNHKPSRDYLDQWKPTLDRQLQQAAHHLALLLNVTLVAP